MTIKNTYRITQITTKTGKLRVAGVDLKVGDTLEIKVSRFCYANCVTKVKVFNSEGMPKGDFDNTSNITNLEQKCVLENVSMEYLREIKEQYKLLYELSKDAGLI